MITSTITEMLPPRGVMTELAHSDSAVGAAGMGGVSSAGGLCPAAQPTAASGAERRDVALDGSHGSTHERIILPAPGKREWSHEDEAAYERLVVMEAFGQLSRADTPRLDSMRETRYRLRSFRSAAEILAEHQREQAVKRLEDALSEYLTIVRPTRQAR